MALKSKKYAMYEAIQYEMRKDPLLSFFYEYQRPTASGPGGKIIDIYTEFGYPRVWDWGPIDEAWIGGCAIGAAVQGVRTIANFPSMTTFYPAEFVFNQAGKFYAMHGQQFTCDTTLIFDMARRIRWSGPQHADVGQEAAFANMP
jgi:pyruvate/2-oxoglutarate/acetoin dehydrogenase E1 component